MSVEGLMALDLLAGVLAAVAWLGAGAAAAARHVRVAAGLFVLAVLASLARGGLVLALAGAGWWFVQEKLTLTLPLLAAGTAAAAVLAAPSLARAALGAGQSRLGVSEAVQVESTATAAHATGARAVGEPTAGPGAAAEAGPAAETRAATEAGRGAVPGAAALVRPWAVTALFGAGYAATAGPVVTLLMGYPATWSTAMITVVLVAAAVLTTQRLLAPGTRVRGTRAAVAATVVAGLIGGGLAFLPADDVDTGRGPAATSAGTMPASNGHGAMPMPGGHGAMPMPAGHAAMPVAGGRFGAGHPAGAHTAGTAGYDRPVTALRGPAAPAPGGTVRRYELTARTATVTLSSGRKVAAWTFNGTVPGPPITATEGDLVEVRLRNADISAGVTLHWHGYDVPAGEDGVPGLTQDSVRPGQEFVYRFRALQVGTYWYHTHEVSDKGVKMGLYGALVVTRCGPAPPGADLPLPVHTFAGRTVLGDHDRPIERRVAPGTAVRLRLVNTDNTPHRFTLAGARYRVVAVDGSDLHAPGEVDRVGLRLPAGGRYDLAFTLAAGAPVTLAVDDRVAGLRLTPDPTAPASGAAPGSSPENDGTRTDTGEGGADATTGTGRGNADAGDVGTTNGANAQAVDDEAGQGGQGAVAVPDTQGWPELDLTRYGTPAGPLPYNGSSRFDRDFTMVLDQGLAVSEGRPLYAHTVNGRAFPSVPTQQVRDGDLVRMTVVNRGRETHPWHLHGHRVLVLARDGRAPTGTPLWLDTFDVRPGEVWQVAFRASNPGVWMNHCHNLSHADQGMMLMLDYEGVTTPFHGAHGG
ncbi:multicopper oxidase domain-containing protein [Sphaerisporangium sp. NPDC005289]|uniref:multicopper oxidase family protein n=1 Tax=Sphaerisporangium sp. NPDC005289 TaxID=3155247 RepID=UPI0033BA6BE6